MRNNHSSQRRGLVLLIVLGMLALFGLLVVTYVVFASDSRTASLALAKSDHRALRPTNSTDHVLKLLVRGSADPRNPIWGHDLLRDLYGSESVVGNVGTWPANPVTISTGRNEAELVGGTLLKFPLRLNNDTTNPPIPNPPQPIAIPPSTFTSRVITFTSGPFRNRSFTILGHDSALITGWSVANQATDNRISIDLSEVLDETIYIGGTPTTVGEAAQSTPNQLVYGVTTVAADIAGHSFIINDGAFDGTGYIEYKRTGQSSVSTVASAPVPLLPNYPRTWRQTNGTLGTSPYLPSDGEADESYDAADYNDFYMSHQFTGGSSSEDIIPSFHRPAIILYFASRYDLGDIANPTITPRQLNELLDRMEMSTLRLLSLDVTFPAGLPTGQIRRSNRYRRHDNAQLTRFPTLELNLAASPMLGLDTPITATDDFDGDATPDITEIKNFLGYHIYGPWDVDTDGDSIPDAVWADLNLPMQAGPNGKMLKVLSAIQVLPMDGRLDINATGEVLQAESDYPLFPSNVLATASTTSLPQGTGYGPAEIGLRHLFATEAAYRQFLNARYATKTSSVENPFSVPGSAADDSFSVLTQREYRTQHRHDTLPGLPRDIRGRQSLAIDRAGQILIGNRTMTSAANNYPTDYINDPYEAKPLGRDGGDSMYSIAEAERVMRRADPDYALLPGRLEGNLNSGSGVGKDVRDSITPRSVAVTQIAPATDQTSDTLRNPVYNWLERQFEIQRDSTLNTQVPSFANFSIDTTKFEALFPFEFKSGQRLNLNRLLGNGLDDNNNSQIDEPIEWITDVLTPNTQVMNSTVPLFNASMSHFLAGRDPNYLDRDVNLTSSGPGAIRYSGMETRQLLAREIYCMLQILVPYQYVFPGTPRANVTDTPNPTDPDVRRFRARRLAQWAVNIVDFRDSDSAFTRFVYDIEPFNNSVWDLTQANETGIVWGMEQPELLLTENVSFHDRRVKDTDLDVGSEKRVESNQEADDDPDQYRIPQGTTILELYAPRRTGLTSNADLQVALPGVSSGLYTLDASGEVALNLAAASPSTSTQPAQPVWRIAISNLQQKGQSPPETPDEIFRNPSIRSNYLYQPNSPALAQRNGLYFNLDDTTSTVASVDRVVYFTTSIPTTIADLGVPANDHAYYNRTNNTTLKGGQYLVVAPREVTIVGSENVTPPVDPPTFRPSPQRLFFPTSTMPNRDDARLIGIDGQIKTTTNNPQVRDIVKIIAAGNTPPSGANPNPWTTAFPNGIGLSISEPRPGNAYNYQVPTKQLNSDDVMGFAAMPPDSYHDYKDSTGNFPDEPFDYNNNSIPNGDLRTRTEENVRTAYLQRLADPNRPYDEVLNPYITVDWMPMDLTIFNGEDDVDTQLTTMNGPIDLDPRDPSAGNRANLLRFGTRQRQGESAPTNNYLTYNSNRPPQGTAVPADPSAMPNPVPAVYFPYQLSSPTVAASTSSLGFINENYTLNPVPLAGYVGVPQDEFCSLPWHNRTYNTPLELMLVPMSHPGQINQEFTERQSISGEWYTQAAHWREKPFGELPPFFSSTNYSVNGSNNVIRQCGADLGMLLTFAETPSPWAEAKESINVRAAEPGTTTASNQAYSSVAPYRTPYNQIPTHRTAGKINLNAIAEPLVWKGIEWNMLDDGQRGLGSVGPRFWNDFLTSRTGYKNATNPATPAIPAGSSNRLDPDHPTEFAGVFKEPMQSLLAPNLSSSVANGSTAQYHLKRSPMEVGLLRQQFDPSNANSNNPPLFARDGISHFNTVRHPHAFYQNLSRLPNLVTTHSNVFAVRITLGYFEWDEAEGLLQEHLADVGRNKRHRSFFMIDRSIPVGYQPGKDLNTDKTVLVRRYFE